MKAQLLERISDLNRIETPLRFADVPTPEAQTGEVLIRVEACGVCHTELDEIEGRTPPPQFPVIPGHQVVGRIVQAGKGVASSRVGERVGVAWIYGTCGQCTWCLEGRENLCPDFLATGRDRNGGYAEFMVASESYTFAIPPAFSAAEAAPLLCAGSIGYRSFKLADIKRGDTVCLTGFGASAELVLRLLKRSARDIDIFVLARSQDVREKALEMGASWAGDFDTRLPTKVDAIIDTTPAWKPVLVSLEYLQPGGRLVINAIRKESGDKDELMNLQYAKHLWMEKEVKSVANVTREDIAGFLEEAAINDIRPAFRVYGLEEANRVLTSLKRGKMRGSNVLVPG